MQGNKAKPLPPQLVEAVTASIDSLVQSVENDVPYGDLDGLKVYLQCTIDYGAYEEDLKKYKAALTEKKEDLVRRGRDDFRAKNGRLLEEVLWGWCPFWLICCEDEDIFQRLPPLPWRHDGIYHSPRL